MGQGPLAGAAEAARSGGTAPAERATAARQLSPAAAASRVAVGQGPLAGAAEAARSGGTAPAERATAARQLSPAAAASRVARVAGDTSLTRAEARGRP